MRITLCLLTLFLAAACSYTEYSGVRGQNIEVAVDNQSGLAVDYQRINWDRSSYLFWVEKEGTIVWLTTDGSASQRLAMRVVDGEVTMRLGSETFTLPVSSDFRVVIPADPLALFGING